MNNASSQSIAPDITLAWLENPRIAYFAIRTVARNPLAAWFESCKKIMDEWPVDQLVLMIHDNNYPGSSFTPSLRDYGNKLFDYRPEVTVRMAIILPRTLMNQVISTFLRSIKKNNREARIFSSIDDARQWLEAEDKVYVHVV